VGGSAEGSVKFRGEELLGAPEKRLRAVRGKEIALVLQSASSAWNPAVRLEDQFREAWKAHSKERWEAGLDRLKDTMRRFQLPTDAGFLRRYPRQVSIGQAQRLLIAMALLHQPAVLIADEITSALDAVTQREVMRCIEETNVRYGAAVLFITHTLSLLRGFCHKVAVLHEGRIVESGSMEQVLSSPRHEYTRLLLDAAFPSELALR
ncbi:MAG: ABC transporter ATP-binding protein, partial [Candidatus Solibacter usitatus]|nr:ABC transporter ATP-binding protein [Candidatus Solibacter usitatus]